MFRPWAQRMQDPERPLQSNEDDPELLITIPFNGTVKIKAICLIGQPSPCSLCRALQKCICSACSRQHGTVVSAAIELMLLPTPSQRLDLSGSPWLCIVPHLKQLSCLSQLALVMAGPWYTCAPSIPSLPATGGSNDGSAPAKVRAFVNRDALDFGSVADMPPTQQWDLQESGQADMEYPTQ